jgi:death on curing protein
LPSGRRHYRVTEADAISAHERALEIGGGIQGIKSLDDLLSAIGRPYSGYFVQIERKAAALFEAIIRNHGFADGYKRTAVILTDLLIEQSGYELTAANEDTSLDEAVEALAVWVAGNQHPAFDEIVAWFKVRIRRSEA